MFASLAERRRRPLWGWVSFLLLIALASSLFVATKSKAAALSEASTDAELMAQTELATLLEPRDLIAPVTGERAAELGADIDARITSVSRIDAVRIYSSLGRILYADDPAIVGTRPSYLRNLTFEVASGEAQTQVRAGMLQTYVPIWLSPGGTVVVAEMSQILGPIASRAATAWYWAALASCLLLLVATGMVILTSRARPVSMPVQVFSQAPVRLPEDRVVETAGPVYQQAGFRQIEEQRQAAEMRAQAAERNLKSVQKQLKEALGQITALEKRSSGAESRSAAGDAELASLREQLSQTTERLNKAEIDGKAIRERLALRQQELDEARGQLAAARADTGETDELRRKLEKAQGGADELEELRQRLELAERRADEMAGEMERMEADLEYTASQLHMSKLSEALREIDHEAANGANGDGVDGAGLEEAAEPPLERPVIIRSSRGKGR